MKNKDLIKAKLKNRFKKSADKAGFIFWSKEDYGPGEGYIDWASNYDSEIQKYSALLIKDILSEITKMNIPGFEKSHKNKEIKDFIKSKIKTKFDI
ncbi:hypothetical protein GW796_09810 [archaeon]|nr:hypothetical protein [archaeon]